MTINEQMVKAHEILASVDGAPHTDRSRGVRMSTAVISGILAFLMGFTMMLALQGSAMVIAKKAGAWESPGQSQATPGREQRPDA